MKKHILCLGDSNTHGYCADPADCADHGIRFNEDERWTCRLQTALGSEYLVTEEGLSGRTTVFVDPIHASMDALSVAYALLKSHEVIDLLIIMLGTNDVKERFGANAACIAAGWLLRGSAFSFPAWAGLGLFMGVMAQLGDFFESALKRAVHIKDSGKILPGHGGVLDRIDSVLFASAAFTLSRPFLG